MPPQKPEKTGYGASGLILHWGTALLFLAAFLLGENMEDMARGPDKVSAMGVHLFFGALVFVAVVPRLAWRLIGGIPSTPAAMPWWERWSASAVHLGLYAVMIGLPVTGFLAATSLPVPVPVFGLFEVPPLATSPLLHEAGEEAHEFLVGLAVFLVIFHVIGTVWHIVIRRDGIAGRMIPFLARPQSEQAASKAA